MDLSTGQYFLPLTAPRPKLKALAPRRAVSSKPQAEELPIVAARGAILLWTAGIPAPEAIRAIERKSLALWAAAGAGNREALGELLEMHRGQIIRAAERIAKRDHQLDMGDLIVEGNKSLERAVARFDPTRGELSKRIGFRVNQDLLAYAIREGEKRSRTAKMAEIRGDGDFRPLSDRPGLVEDSGSLLRQLIGEALDRGPFSPEERRAVLAAIGEIDAPEGKPAVAASAVALESAAEKLQAMGISPDWSESLWIIRNAADRGCATAAEQRYYFHQIKGVTGIVAFIREESAEAYAREVMEHRRIEGEAVRSTYSDARQIVFAKAAQGNDCSAIIVLDDRQNPIIHHVG